MLNIVCNYRLPLTVQGQEKPHRNAICVNGILDLKTRDLWWPEAWALNLLNHCQAASPVSTNVSLWFVTWQNMLKVSPTGKTNICKTVATGFFPHYYFFSIISLAYCHFWFQLNVFLITVIRISAFQDHYHLRIYWDAPICLSAR